MGTFSRLCDLFKYWTMWQYLGKRALGVLQWKTNRKSYIAYRMACIPTTFSDLAGSGLHYSVDLRIQTYTKPVPLNYGKLATEYAWIYGYFFAVYTVCCCVRTVHLKSLWQVAAETIFVDTALQPPADVITWPVLRVRQVTWRTLHTPLMILHHRDVTSLTHTAAAARAHLAHSVINHSRK